LTYLVEFHPYVYQASREIVEYCKKNGIAIEAYTPLGPISYKPGGPVDEVIEKLAKKYNRSPAQILLKWNLIKGLIFSCFFVDFIYFFR
jgi:2-dehydropantolactone reductase